MNQTKISICVGQYFRYTILAGGKTDMKMEGKKAAGIILENTPDFGAELYRLGHTKVFFRAGALAKLEEERDELVLKWLRMIQGEVFKRVKGVSWGKRRDQRELLVACQRNFRKYMALRDWG